MCFQQEQKWHVFTTSGMSWEGFKEAEKIDAASSMCMTEQAAFCLVLATALLHHSSEKRIQIEAF